MGGWKRYALDVSLLLEQNPKLTPSQAEWIVLSGKEVVWPEEIMAKVIAAGASCEVLRNGHYLALTPDGRSIEFTANAIGKPHVYVCDGAGEGWAYRWLAEAGVSPPPKTPQEIAADLTRAAALWREAVPYQNTLGEAYLRDRRHITVPLDNVRFHAGMRALLARRQWLDDTPRGLVITHLTSDGRRDWREDLGIKSGGVAIRLSPAGPKLLVGEGLETTASVMQRTGLPGWCAGTANDLKAIKLPLPVREVVVLQDNDPAGRRAAEDLYWRCRREGRIARVAAPPRGYNDWNEHHVKN